MTKDAMTQQPADPFGPANWKDRPDQWTEAIEAVHPMRSDDPKRHERFTLALEMVGNRHGKYELVALVQWLLTERDAAEADAAKLREAFDYACGLLPGGAGALDREADTYVLNCMVNVGELKRVRSLRQALQTKRRT